MKLLSKICVAALFVSGCYGWPLSPNHNYHVYVAPGFSAEQHQQIIDAVFDWQRATNGFITFDLVGCPQTDATITISPTTSADLRGALGLTHNDGVSDDDSIQLATDDSLHFAQAALHELGHAVGLNHAASGIMCAEAWCASTKIECIDLQQLCKVWDNQCDASTMPSCDNE